MAVQEIFSFEASTALRARVLYSTDVILTMAIESLHSLVTSPAVRTDETMMLAFDWHCDGMLIRDERAWDPICPQDIARDDVRSIYISASYVPAYWACKSALIMIHPKPLSRPVRELCLFPHKGTEERNAW